VGVAMLSGTVTLFKPQRWEHKLAIRSMSSGEVPCSKFRYRDHMGTKSMYVPPTVSSLLHAGGKLLHVSILGRHGSRFPTKKNVRRIAEMHRILDTLRSAHSPDWLKTVERPYNIEQAGLLTELGKREMLELGSRLWTVYGEQGRLNRTRVRSTFKERAQESARQFARGWFGGGNAGVSLASRVEVHPKVPRDRVLRFFECQAYNAYRAKLKQHREENLPHFNLLAKDISKRLSLQRPIAPAIARTIMHSCMYDIARDVDCSRFCRLLTPEEVLMVESAEEDFESFRSAHEKFPWVAAPLLEDILQSIKSAASGSPSCVQADVRIAHAETLVPLVLLFDLKESEDQGWQCRSWIASTSPMGANVAFELYEMRNEQLIVRIRLNERYVQRIGSCGGKDYCTIDEIEDLYKRSTAEHNWDGYCEGDYVLPKDDSSSSADFRMT